MSRFSGVFLLAAASAFAHVGSPDVFYDGQAGPFRLLVTIRTPSVIPGVAEIEVRSAANDVQTVHIVPTPLTGPGATFAPVPDLAQRSKDDPQFFTGSLWMMTTGSWQVRVTAEGAQGKGDFSVPVPALSSSTKKMQAPIGVVLAALGLLLVAGVVSIVGAGVREGQLEPGLVPDPARVRRARGGGGGAPGAGAGAGAACAVGDGCHRGLGARNGCSGRSLVGRRSRQLRQTYLQAIANVCHIGERRPAHAAPDRPRLGEVAQGGRSGSRP